MKYVTSRKHLKEYFVFVGICTNFFSVRLIAATESSSDTEISRYPAFQRKNNY